MLISSLDELRLFSPSNAIDNLDSLAGFISSSEHDFLEEKLGTSLYAALITYYAAQIKPDPAEYISQITDGAEVPPFARLLYVAQKVVTYDALARAVNLQAISVNGSGVNVASADQYKAADATTIADYKKACIKEAHSAVNELLTLLERWTKEVAATDAPDEKMAEIVEKWRMSRFFFLAASMLIPSAVILQEYYNIYESREKFITLLPDIRYIQEDLLCPIFGDEFIEYIVAVAINGTDDKMLSRIIHNLRKIVARHLETRLLKATDPRKETAYNEAIKLTERLSEYLQLHQPDYTDELAEAFALSPLFITKEEKLSPTPPAFENNADGNVIFVTPGLA